MPPAGRAGDSTPTTSPGSCANEAGLYTYRVPGGTGLQDLVRTYHACGIGADQGRQEEAHEKAFLHGDGGTEDRPRAVPGDGHQEVTDPGGKRVKHSDFATPPLMLEEEGRRRTYYVLCTAPCLAQTSPHCILKLTREQGGSCYDPTVETSLGTVS